MGESAVAPNRRREDDFGSIRFTTRMAAGSAEAPMEQVCVDEMTPQVARTRAIDDGGGHLAG